MRRTRRRPTGYELTLVGELGPVLRAMLEPSATATSSSQTIMRVRARDDEDLVDVAQRLKSQGLDIANITALHRGG